MCSRFAAAELAVLVSGKLQDWPRSYHSPAPGAKSRRRRKKTACNRARLARFNACPIRTCLWSCVGRRGSGQEASQPPLKRPAAGDEPAYPAQRGTRLEATTDRAFLVSVGLSKGRLNPKRLVYLAGRAEGTPPFQTMAPRGHGAAPDLAAGPLAAGSRLAGQRERSRASPSRAGRQRIASSLSFASHATPSRWGMPP